MLLGERMAGASNRWQMLSRFAGAVALVGGAVLLASLAPAVTLDNFGGIGTVAAVTAVAAVSSMLTARRANKIAKQN